MMAPPIVAVLCAYIAIAGAQRDAYELIVQSMQEYPLPELPYAYDGLEPFLDAATLRVHHQGHHKAYTNKMNVALKDWREHEPDSPLAQASIAEILRRISEVPSRWRTRLRNNGGGYLNHILYWSTMCRDALPEPEGELREAIEQQFSNFSNFQTEFSQEAAGLFGSGYVWLCATDTSPPELKIISTQNQDCPLSDGLYPLLVLDVWEHAHYLKHQNRRAAYIKAWWEVVCWEQVAALRQFWREQRYNTRHSEL